jgi:flagellar basal body-associated protein FliL
MTDPNRPSEENPEPASYPPPADPFATGGYPEHTPSSGQPAYPASPSSPAQPPAYPVAPDQPQQYGQPQYGQPAQPTAPQYGQPPAYGQQPQYGQQPYPPAAQPTAPLPQYGQPPAYGQQPQYNPGAAQVPPAYGTPPTSGGPTSGTGYPSSGGAYPTTGQAYPGMGYPATGQFPGQPEAPKKKSKALMITLITLSVLLVLCLGGGVAAYFAVKNTDQGGQGAADPKAAATAFMEAFYKDQSVADAEKTVCVQARDSKTITSQIDAIKKLSDTYSKPAFTWDTPEVSDTTEKDAKVTVKLTMTTADEKVSKQELVLTTINDQGWWVCDVQSK